MITVPEKVMANFITADGFKKKQTVVRQFMNRSSNGGGYCRLFGPAARNFLIGKGQSRSEIDDIIAQLRSEALTRHEKPTQDNYWKIEAKVTAAAFNGLIASASSIEFGKLNFVLPPKSLRKVIRFDDVEIKVSPDLLVESQRNGIPLEGAFRFMTNKMPEYRLTARASELVASMQHELLLRNWEGKATPDHHLSMVLETHIAQIRVAPDDIERSREVLDRGCREFSRIWHELRDDQAA